MLKWIKKLLGICDHEYSHITNIITVDGPTEVLGCTKCFKYKYIHWGDK